MKLLAASNLCINPYTDTYANLYCTFGILNTWFYHVKKEALCSSLDGITQLRCCWTSTHTTLELRRRLTKFKLDFCHHTVFFKFHCAPSPRCRQYSWRHFQVKLDEGKETSLCNTTKKFTWWKWETKLVQRPSRTFTSTTNYNCYFHQHHRNIPPLHLPAISLVLVHTHTVQKVNI